MPRFLFDANIPWQVPKALSFFDFEVRHVNHVADLGQSASDEAIFKWCQRNNAVLVTQDWKLRKRAGVLALIGGIPISIAFFRPPSRKGWAGSIG